MSVISPEERSANGLAWREVLASILIVGLLAAVAVHLYVNQVKKGHDASVQANLNTIANSIAAAVSAGQANPPALEVSGRIVTLDGETVTTLAPGVVLGTLQWTSADNWCIDAKDPAGKHAKEPGYRYKAADKKTDAGQCA
jgi:type II secretory pathway pseudopilin PulG